jgi:hypothetical protein
MPTKKKPMTTAKKTAPKKAATKAPVKKAATKAPVKKAATKAPVKKAATKAAKRTRSDTAMPRLGGARLGRVHLDRIVEWLAGARSAVKIRGGLSHHSARRRALQAELNSWSAAERGVDAGPSGLDGLWRATRIVQSEKVVEDRPDDDIESIEAAHDPAPDDFSTWSDAIERLYYFLEIRGDTFREIDASAYPVVHEVVNFDGEVYTHARRASDSKAGAFYDLWDWAISVDDAGFAAIAGARPHAVQLAGLPAPDVLVLHRFADGDASLIDRVTRPGVDLLERTVFFLSDGVNAFSAVITYERYAAPIFEARGEASRDLALQRAPTAPAKRAMEFLAWSAEMKD